MLDYINEDTFTNFATYKLNLQWGIESSDDELQKNNVIFCHPKHLYSLLNTIKSNPHKFILITHGSDHSVDSNVFHSKSDNIVKWFAENADYVHKDLIPIPIGLSPEYCEDFRNRIKFFISNIDELKNNEKTLEQLYCNWDNNTNFDIRSNVLKNIKLPYLWESNLPYSEYIQNMSKHKFIISPPGNGTDCHRTWEALYMNCFPVVIKHRMYNEFADLPIIQVNNYSEVTYELLHSYLNKEYNYEKLYMSYWKKRIQSEFDKL